MDQPQSNPYSKYKRPETAGTQSNPYAKYGQPGTSESAPSTDYQSREVATLPEPHAGMFDQMDDADAKLYHDAYANHPNSIVGEDGSVTYNGKVVPPAEGNSTFVEGLKSLGEGAVAGANPIGNIANAVIESSDYIPDWLSRRGQGAGAAAETVNMAKSQAETLAATGGFGLVPGVGPALEAGSNLIPSVQDLKDNAVKAVQEYMPGFNPQGENEHFGANATEIGAAIYASNKAMAALKAYGAAPEIIQKFSAAAPKIAGYLTKTLEYALQGAAGTVALPAKSSTGVTGNNAWIKLIDGLDDKTPSEAQNVIAGRVNMLIDGVVVGAGLQGAGKILGTLGTITKNLIGSFVKPALPIISHNARLNSVFKDVTEDLRQYTGVETPEEMNRIQNKVIDTLSDPKNQKIVYDVGVEGVKPVEAGLDTAGTIQRGLGSSKSAEDIAIQNVFKGQRNRVLHDEGERTLIKADEPGRALKDLVSQTGDAFNTKNEVQRSAETLQDIGKIEVGHAEGQAQKAQEGVTAGERAIQDTIDQEPTIGSKLAKARTEPPSAGMTARNQTVKEVLKDVKSGNETAQAISKAGFQKLREAGVGLPDEETYATAIKSAIKQLPPEVRGELKTAGADLGKLKADVIPTLRKLKTKLVKAGESSKAVDDTIAAINNQIAKLKNGPKKLFEEADAGYQAFNDSAKSGVFKDIKDIAENKKWNVPTRTEQQTNVLLSTMKSDNPDRVQHFVKTIATPEYGGNAPKVLNLATDNIVDSLRKTARNGVLKPEDISSAIDEYRQLLKAPEFKDAAKNLDDFEKTLYDQKGKIKSLQDIAKSAEDFVKETKTKVYSGVLKDFFQANGEPLPNGMKSFAKLISDEQGGARLKKIIELSEKKGSPIVKDALKSAWSNLADDVLFGGDVTKTGADRLSAAGTSLIKDDTFWKTGKLIFKDHPEVMDAMKDLLDTGLKINNAVRGPAAKSGDSDFVKKEATGAFQRFNRLWNGPLSKQGTRWNVLWSAAMKFVQPQEAMKKMKDQLMADPELFAQAFRQFKNPKIKTAENAKMITQFLANTGIYGDADENDFKDKTWDLNPGGEADSLIGKKNASLLEQTESVLGGALSKGEDLVKQSGEALGLNPKMPSNEPVRLFGGDSNTKHFPSEELLKPLKLTPQEQNIAKHHTDNLRNGKYIMNENESTSTVKMLPIQDGDKWYAVPTVWDGKFLSDADTIKKWKEDKSHWPSYNSKDTLTKRYGEMHDALEADINWLEENDPDYQDKQWQVKDQKNPRRAMESERAHKFQYPF